jgi:molecular chaperone GrpE
VSASRGPGTPEGPGRAGSPAPGPPLVAEEPSEPSAEERLAAAEDKLLRALADLDNLRKRTAREVDRARREGREEVLRSWLEVADSAERALAALAARADDPLFAGLGALAAQIESVLRREGVERVGTVGEPFDPERHEAVGTAHAEGIEEGGVAAVARPGYRAGERLLRPAEVIVARGRGGP